jgi:hypothetical protein
MHSANLSNSTFYKTVFTDATLAQANLAHANFNLALLENTDLEEAFLHDTIFAALDLCGAKNLATVQHEPSSILSIGTDTLLNTLRSSGGVYSHELEVFFSRGGVSIDMLASIRPVSAPAS